RLRPGRAAVAILVSCSELEAIVGNLFQIYPESRRFEKETMIDAGVDRRTRYIPAFRAKNGIRFEKHEARQRQRRHDSRFAAMSIGCEPVGGARADGGVLNIPEGQRGRFE